MNSDQHILRELGKRYADAAADGRNEERRRLHTAVNDLRMERPVVLIDEVPWNELESESLRLRCRDPELREAERALRRALYQWAHFPADMILPGQYPLPKVIRSTGIGVEVDEETLATDHDNPIISHEYHDQMRDDADLERLHPPVITYDEAETLRRQAKVQEALGDTLEVALQGAALHCVTWDDISRLKGVNSLLIDLVEEPEFLHRLVAKLTDIFLDTVRQYEEQGLFQPRQLSVHCTSALTNDLPQPDFDGKARARDVWGRGAAQILASVSPAMHKEFDIDYMKRAMEPFGLVYYGCCEPLDGKIDIVEQLPHLRKISVTPWADVHRACERIGRRYVVASKPNPSHVAVDRLDTELVQGELGGILEACKRGGCACDIVLKDISTVRRNPRNLVEWERAAMALVLDW